MLAWAVITCMKTMNKLLLHRLLQKSQNARSRTQIKKTKFKNKRRQCHKIRPKAQAPKTRSKKGFQDWAISQAAWPNS